MEALSMSSFGKESIEDADIDIIDIDMFNSIMQEKPPDPGELPHSHMTQEQVASVAPQWLESMNGPSAGFDDMGSTITGLEQVNPVTHEVFPVSHSPESLQSRTSSESSEFSFLSQGDPFHDSQFPFQQGGKMVASDLWQGNSLEFKHEFVDEFKPSNTLDDTKDNASCAFNAPSAQPPCKLELVDLTTDTDSDCEDELVQQHLGLTGKRNLPSWMEHSDRLSKILCTGPPKEEHYSREIQDLQNPFSLNFLHRFPTDANGYMKPETIAMAPMSLASYERTCSKASMRMPEWGTIPSNFSRGSSYANNGLQDGLFLRNILPCQLTTGKDNSRERIVNHGLEGHSSSIREEASLEEGAMTIPLLRHQRIALAWMEKREKGSECAGGILADDQGLGKTVSTIALILRQKPSTRNPSAEAVEISYDDTPTVNLDDEECNPLNEFSCPSDKGVSAKVNLGLKGRPHAGTLVVCPTSVLRQWANELKEKVSAEKPLSVHLYHGSGRTKDPNELAKHDVVLTTYSIVSMEVPKQPLPDDKEADGRNASCYGLSLLMRPEDGNTNKKKTGKGKKAETDVEKAGPLAKVAWFRVVLDEAQSIKNRRTQAARACWGLRAKRRWCLSGTPIQNTIDDLYSYFRFLKYEPYSIYKHFRSEIKEPISRDPARGYRNLQTVLQKILLRRTKNSHIDGEPIINLPEKVVCLEQVDFTSEERAFYTALETQSREQFQIYAEAGTVQSNYVNILWMLLRLRQACDHPCLVKEGHSDLSGRSNLEHARKLLPEKRRILLSVLERNCDPCTICSDAPEDAVITICSHVFCRQCLSDRLTQDDSASCPYPKCEASLNSSAIFSWSALRLLVDGCGEPSEPPLDLLAKSSFKIQSDASSKIKAVIKTLRALPPSLGQNMSPHGFEGSALDAGRTEKAIVFSQWTSMLDLLEVSLKKEGFCYRRLDGTMSIQARDRALSDFKLLPEVSIIIMSLKAASLGLNMVTASHVLLIDVWWNPTTEDQAIDRAHRIGQTRVVKVSRFTVRNTIEDRILELQERKRKMVASAFGEETPADQKTRLSMDEMKYLFRI